MGPCRAAFQEMSPRLGRDRGFFQPGSTAIQHLVGAEHQSAGDFALTRAPSVRQASRDCAGAAPSAERIASTSCSSRWAAAISIDPGRA